MAERSEIDRILADQYGQGIEPPPLTNFTADPQNELGTTATTADVGQVMDRMYSGVPGLFRSAADRVRGASRQDNILAGGLDTAANWVSGTPRIGEDTLAPLGLGALAMPFAVPGAVGIFGGRLARTADQDALRRAEEMATAGRPREDIWNETGWFRGRDGQWRFEIDDSAMRPQVPIVEWLSRREDGTLMAPNLETAYNVAARNLTPQAPMRAKRLFEHEELARAYPYGFNRSDQHGDIMGIPVQLMEGGSSAAMIAGHLPNVTIGLHESLPPGTARSAMLHELQHAVQQREGFTPGGSPRDAPGVYNDLADEINRLIAQSGGNLDRATPEVAARVGELRRQIRSIPSDPQQLYRHLAGEVEARNVQTRAGMSPEQRRASPPWETQDVPDVDQILRQYYGGPQHSIMTEPLYHGSPQRGLTELSPSERGPLGPGVYATPSQQIADRGYAGPDGVVYTLPERGRDIYRGHGHRTDDEWFGFKNDRERLINAADEAHRPAIAELVNRMWSSDGYPLYQRIRGLLGSDEAAQEMYRRAGFEGVSGLVDGPEVLLFNRQGLTP